MVEGEVLIAGAAPLAPDEGRLVAVNVKGLPCRRRGRRVKHVAGAAAAGALRGGIADEGLLFEDAAHYPPIFLTILRRTV